MEQDINGLTKIVHILATCLGLKRKLHLFFMIPTEMIKGVQCIWRVNQDALHLDLSNPERYELQLKW